MKLGPHIFEGSELGKKLAIDGNSTVVKLIGSYDKSDDYRVGNPNRLVWGRFVVPNDDTWRHFTPYDYYNAFIREHIIHPANKKLDAFETGLNEDFQKAFGETPDYNDIQKKAEFEAVIAALIAADGKKPVLGQFSVGTPSGTTEEQLIAWERYLLALQAAVLHNGFISCHWYNNIPGSDGPIKTLIQTKNKYRLPIKILISEAGHEGPYKKEISLQEYINQMILFEAELQKYPEIIGASIFAFGNCPGKWADYNSDNEVFVNALIENSKNHPNKETPLTGFPGAGQMMTVYNGVNGTKIWSKPANWWVDIYEFRGSWWRVTTGLATNLWVNMAFK